MSRHTWPRVSSRNVAQSIRGQLAGGGYVGPEGGGDGQAVRRHRRAVTRRAGASSGREQAGGWR